MLEDEAVESETGQQTHHDHDEHTAEAGEAEREQDLARRGITAAED